MGTILNNPFYIGSFRWQGKVHSGTHEALIRPELFEQVQNVMHRRSQPQQHKHHFAFRGLLRCAYDDCRITAQVQKKHTYYCCTGHRGKCALPYFREEVLAERLGTILKDIYIPDEILTQLTQSLNVDEDREVELLRLQQDHLRQRLLTVRHRIDQAYQDKVDGKIPEGFWMRKSTEWQAEEQQIVAQQAPVAPKTDRVLDLTRILELANKAYFLYVSQSPAEKGKLLKMVFSNCSIDAVSVYPTYRKPFDVISQRAKTKEWSGREDSNLRPPGPEPGALPG